MPRRRKMSNDPKEFAVAGKLLAALRIHRGLNQEQLAPNIPSAVSYIGRVENGQRPGREWLEAALLNEKALNAPYPRYQEIMEAFHYIPTIKEPTQGEVDKMISVLRPTMQASIFPVYLRDTLTRVLEWNYLFPKISPALHEIESLRHVPMVFLLHDPHYYDPHFAGIIRNRELFAQQQIPILYHEWQQSIREPWCKKMLHRLLQNHAFAELWQKSAAEAGESPAALSYKTRWNTPVELQYSERFLSFHMSLDYIQEDKRFALVTFIPGDVPTLEQCLVWNKDISFIRAGGEARYR